MTSYYESKERGGSKSNGSALQMLSRGGRLKGEQQFAERDNTGPETKRDDDDDGVLPSVSWMAIFILRSALFKTHNEI